LIYIKNSHNIIIGKTFGVGYLFEFANDISQTTGVEIYFDNQPINDARFTQRGVGRIPYPIVPGAPMEILDSRETAVNSTTKRQVTNTGVTVDDPRPGYVYFALALSANRDQTYKDTLDPADLTALIFAIILYSLATFICFIFFLIDCKNKGRQLITLIKPICFLLMVAFILRLTYACYLFSDPQNDRITILFIELPCQIFWTISCLLLIRWLKPRKACGLNCKCCLGSLREFIVVIFFINLGLFIAYLVLLFGFSGGNLYAETPLTYSQIMVSFIWFSWYITLCMIALVWFAIATIAAFCKCLNSALTEKSNLVKRAILISLIVAIMVFVGQTSVQIRTFLWTDFSPFPEFRNWPISLFFAQLLIVDLIPTIPILYSAGTSSLGGKDFQLFQKDDSQSQL